MIFDPASHPDLNPEQATLVRQAADFARIFFQDPKFDASHDFDHVLRVTAMSIKIMNKERLEESTSTCDPLTVILGALMHDIDDYKYSTGQGGHLARDELCRIGMSFADAARISRLAHGVSYTNEVQHPEDVQKLIKQIPELAIVQDADRLDAIGAIGIGRLFAYGACKTNRGLSGSVDHFDEKLYKLEGMMKTETGRELAREYTARLRTFRSWFDEEVAITTHVH